VPVDTCQGFACERLGEILMFIGGFGAAHHGIVLVVARLRGTQMHPTNGFADGCPPFGKLDSSMNHLQRFPLRADRCASAPTNLDRIGPRGADAGRGGPQAGEGGAGGDGLAEGDGPTPGEPVAATGAAANWELAAVQILWMLPPKPMNSATVAGATSATNSVYVMSDCPCSSPQKLFQTDFMYRVLSLSSSTPRHLRTIGSTRLWTLHSTGNSRGRTSSVPRYRTD
jgi:hypothetical protein